MFKLYITTQMNRLKAFVEEIETEKSLSLIYLKVGLDLFFSMVIDNKDTFIEKGKEVIMVFKETEVSIGKNLLGGLSIRNRFKAVITSINEGILLTEVFLDYRGHALSSIITSKSAKALSLKPGDEVEGLVKTNEISLMEK
jgi:molybdate transport system regulatory protein